MYSHRDIFQRVFHITLQNNVVFSDLSNHLENILEPSVSHLSRIIKDVVVDEAPNRVRKMLYFHLSIVIVRYEAYKKGDE